MAHESRTVILKELLDKTELHIEKSEYSEAEQLTNEVLASELKLKDDEARALCILAHCFCFNGRNDDARSVLEEALEIAVAISNSSLEAKVLNEIAIVAQLRSDYKTASSFAERALALADTSHDKKQQAKALNILGIVQLEIANYPLALSYLAHSLSLSEETESRIAMASSLGNIGNTYIQLGDYSKALDYHARSLELCEIIGSKRHLALALGNIGSVYSHLNNYPRALEYYTRALSLAKEIGDKSSTAMMLSLIALLHDNLADHQRALEYNASALQMAEEIGDKMLVAITLGNTGCSWRDIGDYSHALDYLKRALELSQQIGALRPMGYWMHGIASVELKLGNLDAAYQGYLNALHHRRDTLQTNENVADTLVQLGNVLLKLGKSEAGMARLEQGLTLALEIGEKLTAAQAHEQLAGAYEKLGDITKAYEHHQKYYALEKEILSEKTRQQFDSFNIRVAIADKERDAELQRLKAERSDHELRLKERELANTASSLAAQTELLGHFRTDLRKIVLRPDSYGPEGIIKQVREKLKDLPCEMIDFAKFEAQFATVHPEFRAMLETKHPELTPQEVKICLLIHVNLRTSEIARLTCLSERTVDNHRFNIRKKLGLKTEESLPEFLRALDGAKILSST